MPRNHYVPNEWDKLVTTQKNENTLSTKLFGEGLMEEVWVNNKYILNEWKI